LLFKDELKLEEFNLIYRQKSAKGIVSCTLTTEGQNNNRMELFVKSEWMASVKQWKLSSYKTEDEPCTGKQN